MLLLLLLVMELLAPSFVHDEMIIFAAPPIQMQKRLRNCVVVVVVGLYGIM